MLLANNVFLFLFTVTRRTVKKSYMVLFPSPTNKRNRAWKTQRIRYTRELQHKDWAVQSPFLTWRRKWKM